MESSTTFNEKRQFTCHFSGIWLIIFKYGKIEIIPQIFLNFPRYSDFFTDMTNYSLIDDLEAARKKEQTPRKGAVAVISNQAAIAEALEKGYTLKEIHNVLKNQGKMPVAYSAFCNLVQTHITKKKSSSNPKSNNQAKSNKSHIFNPNDYEDIDKELK